MTTPHTDSADELARALEQIEAGPPHGRSCTWNPREIARQALTAYRTRPAPEPAGEAVAWRYTLAHMGGLKTYLTQRQYDMQRPGVQRWYEPFRCANCAAAPAPAQRMSDEQERAAFETHARANSTLSLEKDSDGDYIRGSTETALWGWLAHAFCGVTPEGKE